MSTYPSNTGQRTTLGARLVREGVGPEGYPRTDEPAPHDDVPNDVSASTPHGPGMGRHRRELHPRHVRDTRGAVRVPLGRVLATPGALRALADARANPAEYLARHATGDWGELDAEDWAANDRALAAGERLLSAYRLPSGQPLWIITEAGFPTTTTVLTPDEY